MRYRSATVADFHGVPRILEQAKEPLTWSRLNAPAADQQRQNQGISCQRLRMSCSRSFAVQIPTELRENQIKVLLPRTYQRILI